MISPPRPHRFIDMLLNGFLRQARSGEVKKKRGKAFDEFLSGQEIPFVPHPTLRPFRGIAAIGQQSGKRRCVRIKFRRHAVNPSSQSVLEVIRRDHVAARYHLRYLELGSSEPAISHPWSFLAPFAFVVVRSKPGGERYREGC